MFVDATPRQLGLVSEGHFVSLPLRLPLLEAELMVGLVRSVFNPGGGVLSPVIIWQPCSEFPGVKYGPHVASSLSVAFLVNLIKLWKLVTPVTFPRQRT